MSRWILESYLIGWAIRDPSTMLELVQSLNSSDFKTPIYSTMAKHLFKLYWDNQEITYASLATSMWNDGITDMNVLIKIHDTDKDAPEEICVQPLVDALLNSDR
jgi:hypothetical protein